MQRNLLAIWGLTFIALAVTNCQAQQQASRTAEVTPTQPPMLTSTPGSTPTAQLPSVPLQPLATAAAIRVESWSLDSDWVAYWSSKEEDVETAPHPFPSGTLHLLHIRTGQDCSYPEYVARGYDDGVIWQPDGQVMVVSGGSAERGTPCVDDFVPAAYPPDAELGKFDTALSPEAGYRARTWTQDEPDGTISAVTIIADALTGEVEDVVEWKHEGGVGEFGLGGQWLTEDLFLINETLDRGPLLIAVGNGTIEVVSELFGLPPLEHWEPDNLADLRAEGGVVKGTRTYHIVLHGAGTDRTLYHSETAEVERIPLRHPSYLAFSPDGRWLMLYERYGKDGYERQALSIRPVDPPGSEARLFAEEFSYAVWASEGKKIAVGLPGGAISVFSLPDGVQLGSWTTGEYEALPIAWSPDGNLLAVEGYVSGEWQQGLFLVRQ
jgi:hypothetical protein